MKKLSAEGLKNLQDLLTVQPGTKEVYFNEKGEYLFHEQKGFDEVVSRETILGEEKKKK